MTEQKTCLGILISGRGSNMKAIVKACDEGTIPARVGLVLSNRADAPGLAWAAERGLPSMLLSHREYPSREKHDEAVVRALHQAGACWVCLAGYMRLLSARFVDAFADRIVNIHPSLLPAFPGLHAQQQAYDHGVRVSGCTVHLVDRELDHGPIVLQRSVQVAEDDSADSLADRILHEEHLAYPEALRLLLQRSWRLEGRRLVWLEAEA